MVILTVLSSRPFEVLVNEFFQFIDQGGSVLRLCQ